MSDATSPTRQLADYLIAGAAKVRTEKGHCTASDLESLISGYFDDKGVMMCPKPRKARKSAGSRTFAPPTPQEVTDYSASIDYPLDGEEFCDSYAAKDWKVGKNKMKDWKAAVRNWKRNGWGHRLTTSTTTQTRDYTKI